MHLTIYCQNKIWLTSTYCRNKKILLLIGEFVLAKLGGLLLSLLLLLLLL